jgi:hypothetical protein
MGQFKRGNLRSFALLDAVPHGDSSQHSRLHPNDWGMAQQRQNSNWNCACAV